MADDYKSHEQSIPNRLDEIFSMLETETIGNLEVQIIRTRAKLQHGEIAEQERLSWLIRYKNNLLEEFNWRFAKKLSIYGYQLRLQNQFSSYRNKIAVRNYDDQNFCLSLDASICQCISTLDNRFRYYWTTHGNYILVNKADADSLISITDKLDSNKEILELARNIAALRKNSRVRANIVAEFTALLKNLMNEEISLTALPYSVIIKHFQDEAAAINSNPGRTRDEIRQSARQLDLNLYGHPPINKRTVAVICAIFTALLGAVVGLAIGAHGDSGFESWVETASLTFAGEGAAVGSGVGGLVGFFGTKSYQASYENERATENKAVQSSREKIYETLRSN